MFDGPSCGMVAALLAGIEVTEYHSYEIDEDAITVSKWNWPRIQRHGSVVGASFYRWVDLLLAGSPCQGFSKIGRGLNFNDECSKLYFEFERALSEAQEINPNLYWMLENVDMPREWQDIISGRLGVAPILINSKLLGPVSRPRLYWTNIQGIEQPRDAGVLMRDIIQEAPAKYFLKNRSAKRLDRWINTSDYERAKCISALDTDKGICFTARMYSNWKGNFVTQRGDVRQLTPLECELAQGLPAGYTECVSDTAAYKMLGNGWHVPTVAHILSFIDSELW